MKAKYRTVPKMFVTGGTVSFYNDTAATILNGRIDYFVNGSKVPIGRSPAWGWSTGTYPALGSRYDVNDSQVAGSLYAIRFYSRPLEPVEVAFNAALDQIRYFGADAETMLASMTLPDGSVTESRLGLIKPLRAGQLKIIRVRIGHDGIVSTDDTSVGVSVTLDWNQAGVHIIPL